MGSIRIVSKVEAGRERGGGKEGEIHRDTSRHVPRDVRSRANATRRGGRDSRVIGRPTTANERARIDFATEISGRRDATRRGAATDIGGATTRDSVRIYFRIGTSRDTGRINKETSHDARRDDPSLPSPPPTRSCADRREPISSTRNARSRAAEVGENDLFGATSRD